MSKFKCLIIILLLALGTASCATTASDTVKSFADKYCSQNELGRKAMREQFNNIVAPHEFKVVCEGDFFNE